MGWLLLLVLALSGAGVFYAWPQLEGEAPTVQAPAELVVGREAAPLVIELADVGTGLRSVRVELEKPGAEPGAGELLHEALFLPGSEAERLELQVDAEALGLADGSARVVVRVRDHAWRDGLDGNAAEASVALAVDTTPPRVRVESGLTYLYRGGSGAIVYRVEGEPERDGVEVGDAFFPGYAIDGADPERRVAIFAIPVHSPASPKVEVVATDRAGNRATGPVAAKIFDREFPRSSIGLSSGFLERIVLPLAEANGLETGDPANAFRQVNEEQRRRDEARIREIIGDGSGERRWEGAFLQWKNSSVTSKFAEQRHYQIQGREVSQATHYGFDLAATTAAPVTSSNAGVVAFAGDLGIYGRCVILDHGLGITSLYAHLSSLDVQPGDRVGKGEVIGRSGSTGLAGGDHLHFAILVGSTYVDPLEWWDPRWVDSHVEARLRPSS